MTAAAIALNSCVDIATVYYLDRVEYLMSMMMMVVVVGCVKRLNKTFRNQELSF